MKLMVDIAEVKSSLWKSTVCLIVSLFDVEMLMFDIAHRRAFNVTEHSFRSPEKIIEYFHNLYIPEIFDQLLLQWEIVYLLVCVSVGLVPKQKPPQEAFGGTFK